MAPPGPRRTPEPPAPPRLAEGEPGAAQTRPLHKQTPTPSSLLVFGKRRPAPGPADRRPFVGEHKGYGARSRGASTATSKGARGHGEASPCKAGGREESARPGHSSQGEPGPKQLAPRHGPSPRPGLRSGQGRAGLCSAGPRRKMPSARGLGAASRCCPALPVDLTQQRATVPGDTAEGSLLPAQGWGPPAARAAHSTGGEGWAHPGFSRLGIPRAEPGGCPRAACLGFAQPVPTVPAGELSPRLIRARLRSDSIAGLPQRHCSPGTQRLHFCIRFVVTLAGSARPSRHATPELGPGGPRQPPTTCQVPA